MTADVLDLLGSPQEQRWANAGRVKVLRRVNLPHLADWNYSACDRHDTPSPQCQWRACGFDPFDHQTVSAAFLLMAHKGLDGSQTGCISGDAEMAVHRNGKGFRISLRDLVTKFSGRRTPGHPWDMTRPTYVQREAGDGTVRLVRIANAWSSGVKTTYTVTTSTGRTIRATDEHPFLTERGWLRLDQLEVGDEVHVRGDRLDRGRTKLSYRQVIGLVGHPYARRRGEKVNPYRYPEHRLVAESVLNGLDFDLYVKRLRADEAEGLIFLDPEIMAVHHVDHDHLNNDPDNLQVMTHVQHARLHAHEGTTSNVQLQIALEEVVSVELYGPEETFDIEVADDPHNFLADGFVVHNTGKTNSILLTLCLAKHLGETLRAVLVVPTSAVSQWAAETARFAPGLNAVAVTAGLPKARRLAVYAAPWEVLIVGFHLATRDIDALESLQPLQVVSDDVDPILQTGNKTHKAMVRLTRHADRVVVANATNLQTRLTQLYAASALVGGKEIWGTQHAFEARYVKKEPVYIHSRDSRGRRGTQKIFKAVGYKNLTDFKQRFWPMMIRHRYEDLTDLRIPEVTVENIYLEIHPAQRARYTLLQQGVLELLRRDQPPAQRQVSAMTAWLHGGQVCAGLSALGEDDGPGASVKLDWVVDHVVGEWARHKVVVYARNRGTIDALQHRLAAEGVGYATIWGAEANSEHRAAEVQRFWQDDTCRVMIISAAGERSLNLQCASVLVSIDLNLNPARVMQILGRLRRAGSTHERVFAFNLLATDTQEERYMTSLASRQALFDHIHDEDSSDMFEQLPADVLLRLISP